MNSLIAFNEDPSLLKNYYTSPSLLANYSFTNDDFSYEVSTMDEIKNPGDFNTAKIYFLKKLTFHDAEKMETLQEFLKGFFEFQYTSDIPGLVKVKKAFVAQKEKTLYLIQRNYKKPLTDIKKEMTEIETFIILKQIIKLYFQIKQEDIFNRFLDNEFPLKKLDAAHIYYYRHLPSKLEVQGLEKYKVKVDMLMFENRKEKQRPLESATFHLDELKKITQDLLKNLKKIGVCGRNMLRLMETELRWKQIFTHPLFKIDYEVVPDLLYWHITEEDRKKRPKSSKFESAELDIQKKLGKPKSFADEEAKYNAEPKKMEKDEENLKPDDAVDKGITVSKLGVINGQKQLQARKNQIAPLPNNNHQDIPNNSKKSQNQIILEDGENQSVDSEKFKLKSVKEAKSLSSCDCRCI